jgi:hypothetical protein
LPSAAQAQQLEEELHAARRQLRACSAAGDVSAPGAHAAGAFSLTEAPAGAEEASHQLPHGRAGERCGDDEDMPEAPPSAPSRADAEEEEEAAADASPADASPTVAQPPPLHASTEPLVAAAPAADTVSPVRAPLRRITPESLVAPPAAPPASPPAVAAAAVQAAPLAPGALRRITPEALNAAPGAPGSAAAAATARSGDADMDALMARWGAPENNIEEEPLPLYGEAASDFARGGRDASEADDDDDDEDEEEEEEEEDRGAGTAEGSVAGGALSEGPPVPPGAPRGGGSGRGSATAQAQREEDDAFAKARAAARAAEGGSGFADALAGLNFGSRAPPAHGSGAAAAAPPAISGAAAIAAAERVEEVIAAMRSEWDAKHASALRASAAAIWREREAARALWTEEAEHLRKRLARFAKDIAEATPAAGESDAGLRRRCGALEATLHDVLALEFKLRVADAPTPPVVEEAAGVAEARVPRKRRAARRGSDSGGGSSDSSDADEEEEEEEEEEDDGGSGSDAEDSRASPLPSRPRHRATRDDSVDPGGAPTPTPTPAPTPTPDSDAEEGEAMLSSDEVEEEEDDDDDDDDDDTGAAALCASPAPSASPAAAVDAVAPPPDEPLFSSEDDDDEVDDASSRVMLDGRLAAALKPHQLDGIRFMWRNVVTTAHDYAAAQADGGGSARDKPGCVLAHHMVRGMCVARVVVPPACVCVHAST